MTSKVVKAAIVGGSTLLGRELLDEISNSAAAMWDLQVLEEEAESEGQLTSAGGEPLLVKVLKDSSFENSDLIFFATSQKVTSGYLQAALSSGAAIVDLSGHTIHEDNFQTRSPWMESGKRFDLTTLGATVPHPATIMLTLVIDRLKQRFGAVKVIATILEPASQAGSLGVDELHQQTIGLLSFQDLPKKMYGAQVAFNLQATLGQDALLHLGDVRRRIRDEMTELRSDHNESSTSFSLLQAPVFHGHVISTHITFRDVVDPEAVREALSGILVVSGEDTIPSNQAATETGDILAAVSADPDEAKACWILLAADNLRLTARSAVELGLELLALRPSAHLQ